MIHKDGYHPKKKSKKRLYFFIAAIAAVILCGFGKMTADLYRARQEAAGREGIAAESRGNFLDFEGNQYRRNTAVRAILLIGVDTSGQMEKSGIIGASGQADGIFLVAQDMTRDQVKILMIPRDTMTDIELFDLSGNSLGMDKQHLTLAFAYGDGREKSCEMVKEAVSNLLYGLTVDGYMAVNTSMISVLNDEIGGVEVKIEEPGMEKRDPAMTEGSALNLTGKQAEIFVRYRDINQSQTAIGRMGRQKIYMEGFLNKAKAEAAKDSGLITRLVADIEENMITNMAKDQYMDMGLSILNSSQNFGDNDFIMLPGEGVETELFDEYHPDMDGVKKTVIDLFYKQVS